MSGGSIASPSLQFPDGTNFLTINPFSPAPLSVGQYFSVAAEPPILVLNEFLEYNPGNCVLHWKKSPAQAINPGQVAGSKHKLGYIKVQLNGTLCFVHPVIWFMCNGFDPGDLQIDHHNGDPSDNRIENLCPVTHQQNGFNRKVSSNNNSGVNGVC